MMLVWRCSLILVRSSQDDAVGTIKGYADESSGDGDERNYRPNLGGLAFKNVPVEVSILYKKYGQPGFESRTPDTTSCRCPYLFVKPSRVVVIRLCKVGIAHPSHQVSREPFTLFLLSPWEEVHPAEAPA